MLAARAAAQRKVNEALREKDANEWNIAHDLEEDNSALVGGITEGDYAGKPQQEQQTKLIAASTNGDSANPKEPSAVNSAREDEDVLKHIPLTGLTGMKLQYVRTSNLAISTLNNVWFNSLVMLCISWASLSVGLQTYPTLGASVILNDLDFFVLSVFILEAVIKVLAEGLYPWRFFTGKEMRWNCFDFAIIVMSLPIWGSALGGSSIAILRMLRLMRIMKLVKRVPQLYMIVMGLIGGLKSIGYIMLLLFLVFYLYAISGMYAWQNNDTFHFRSVPIAMVTLFRMATLENWSTVMNINYFGCDRYDGGYYSENPTAAASFEFCNFTQLYGANVTDSSLTSQRALNQVVATVYFITFILISAFVMLSLFIGAITMSMTQSMEHMKRAQEEIEAKKRAEKARARALEAEKRALEAARKRAEGEAEDLKDDMDPNKKGKLSAAERKERQKMREVLMQTWDDCDLTDILTHGPADSKSIKGMYVRLAGYATQIVEHPKFSLFVTWVIILAGIMVGLQSEPQITTVAGGFLGGLDSSILAVFTSEVILKMLAEGLEPWQYFRTAWNVFDFIIVVGSFAKGSGGMLTMLRLLRLLRVLKLVRAFPQLQVIVSALLKGVSSIGYIGLILLLCFYVFGIVGNMLFAENDPFHFQYLHFAMISLFQMATMDGWSDVLYINYYGCDLYGYDAYIARGYVCKPHASGFLAVLYFCSFIVLGGMVLITLFIGVVTTSMEEATQEMEAEKELIRRVEALREQHHVDSKVVSSYMQVFRLLDLDGSGSVEEAELRTGLAAIGKYPSYEELKEMMDIVDEDGSGQIDIVEFVEFMIHVREKSNQQRAAKLAAVEEETTQLMDEDVESDGTPMSTGRKSLDDGVIPHTANGLDRNLNGNRSDEKLLAVNARDDIADNANIESFTTPPGRPWSSPRLGSRSLGPGCNVMPYLSDKDPHDSNVDGEIVLVTRSSTGPINIPVPSEEDESSAGIPIQTPEPRPRSGRVTSKITPSG